MGTSKYQNQATTGNVDPHALGNGDIAQIAWRCVFKTITKSFKTYRTCDLARISMVPSAPRTCKIDAMTSVFLTDSTGGVDDDSLIEFRLYGRILSRTPRPCPPPTVRTIADAGHCPMR